MSSWVAEGQLYFAFILELSVHILQHYQPCQHCSHINITSALYHLVSWKLHGNFDVCERTFSQVMKCLLSKTLLACVAMTTVITLVIEVNKVNMVTVNMITVVKKLIINVHGSSCRTFLIFSPILTKNSMCWQITVKVSKRHSHENSSGVSWVALFGMLNQ